MARKKRRGGLELGYLEKTSQTANNISFQVNHVRFLPICQNSRTICLEITCMVGVILLS